MQWIASYILSFIDPVKGILIAAMTITAICASVIPIYNSIKHLRKDEISISAFKPLLNAVAIFAIPMLLYSGLQYIANKAGNSLNNSIKGAKMIPMIPAFLALGAYEWQTFKAKHQH